MLTNEYHIIKAFCELGPAMILFTVPFIIAAIVAPPLTVIGAILFPLVFGILGIGAGVTTYQSTFDKAMAEICDMVTHAEKAAREYICNS
jgi:CBS domain containing-hemolysin-like protein